VSLLQPSLQTEEFRDIGAEIFLNPNAALLLRRIGTASNLHDMFGENDPARRRAAIDEIFTEDFVFYEPRASHRLPFGACSAG
jgi:hypothetical protein